MPVLEAFTYPPCCMRWLISAERRTVYEPSSHPIARPLGGLETTQRGDHVEPSSRPIALLGARRHILPGPVAACSSLICFSSIIPMALLMTIIIRPCDCLSAGRSYVANGTVGIAMA
jgi:hypothetical protein